MKIYLDDFHFYDVNVNKSPEYYWYTDLLSVPFLLQVKSFSSPAVLAF